MGDVPGDGTTPQLLFSAIKCPPGLSSWGLSCSVWRKKFILLLFSKLFVPSRPSRVEKLYLSVFLLKMPILYIVTIAPFSPNTANVKAAAHSRTDFLLKLIKFCINNTRVFLELPRDQLTAEFDIFPEQKKNCWKNKLKYLESLMFSSP